MHPLRPARRDPAVKEAHEVVGLYGDPDTSWGIAVDLGVRELDAGLAAERLAALCAGHDHLGTAPAVDVVAEADWAARRAALATRGYGGEPLIRVAVRGDGRRLAVGAHHGAVDGLGLVALAAAAMGEPLLTQARGIGDRGAQAGFARSSLRRLREALVDPPPRFAGSGEPSHDEDLSELTRPEARRGTAHLAVAVAAVFGDRGHAGVPLFVVGASRRTGTVPAANRETAYLRLRVPVDAEPGQVRQALASVPPEPDFPATSARGAGPRVTRLLRRRLGATALLSNLGRIDGGVESVAMFPACSGPRAVAIGLASTPGSTTLSLRTRRAEFTADEHARLLDDVAARFFG
jgi:hypothetical protein